MDKILLKKRIGKTNITFANYVSMLYNYIRSTSRWTWTIRDWIWCKRWRRKARTKHFPCVNINGILIEIYIDLGDIGTQEGEDIGEINFDIDTNDIEVKDCGVYILSKETRNLIICDLFRVSSISSSSSITLKKNNY